MNATTITQAAPVSTEITGMIAELTGFTPALDAVVTAIGGLLTTPMDTEDSMNTVAALGACEDANVVRLLHLVIRHIANPDTNPALAGLPTDRKQTLRRLGAEHVAAARVTAEHHTEPTAAELAATIDGA